jgi:hypothetical protein
VSPVRRWRWILPSAAAAAVAALAASGPVGAAGENLLVNPGAESGTEAAAEEGQAPPPRGWAATGAMTVGDYGAAGMPSTAHAESIGGGTKLFRGGACEIGTPCASSAGQEFDVSSSASSIDAGSVSAELSALIGGRDGDDDAGRVRLVFIAADSGRLGDPVELGPVTPADRAGQTKLLPRSAQRTLPAGTRRLRVTLLAEGGDGEELDAFFDNVVLRLGGTSQPPVSVTPSQPAPAPPGGGGSGDDGPPGNPPLTLSTRPVRMSQSGVIVVRGTCERSEGACTGRIRFTTGRRSCGSRRVSVRAGRRARLPLRLGATCRRLVRRSARGLEGRIEFRARDTVVSQALVVRRPAS